MARVQWISDCETGKTASKKFSPHSLCPLRARLARSSGVSAWSVHSLTAILSLERVRSARSVAMNLPDHFTPYSTGHGFCSPNSPPPTVHEYIGLRLSSRTNLDASLMRSPGISTCTARVAAAPRRSLETTLSSSLDARPPPSLLSSSLISRGI